MIGMSAAVKILIIVGLLGPSYCYDLGTQYVYSYNTQVSTREDCPKDQESQIKNVGFQIKSSIHITCVWENEQNKEEKLLKIEFVKPSLIVPKKSSYEAHSSKLERISQSPLYAEWLNGEVKTVFGDLSDDLILKNLKKGIASLLQVKAPSSGPQRDISGDCLIQVEADGRFIKKKKENCFHPAASKFHYGSSEIRSANVTSSSETKVELVAQKSNFVLSAEGTDYFRIHSNMWKRPEVCVYSKTSLSLESENSGASTIKGKSLSEAVETSLTSDGRFKQESLVADILPKKCGSSCKDLAKAISGYKESLSTKNLAKLKSASSFLKLLEIFRFASNEDILSALKNGKFKSVLPQLIDVVAYAQSQSSRHAAVQAIDIFHDKSDLVERLLLGLCTSSSPDAELLQRIMGVLKKGQESKKIHKKIHDTLVVALGALVRSYTRYEKQSPDQIIQDVERFFIKELKACKLPECQVVYLRGLRNAALPSSINVLLEYAAEGGKPALEALLALKNIDHQNFDSKAMKVFEEVFYQIKKKHVSSSRAIAAELLLISRPSVEAVKRIVDELRKPGNSEFTTFVSSKIYKIINNDAKLRSEVKAVLADEGLKYHSFFLKGSSVSYSRPLIAATGVDATYGIEMEMLPGGNLKRSSFDVNLLTPESDLQILSVGMYSEGLSSLGGTSESTESEDEGEATAGMELTVLGVALRPYVFFQGTSELFSLVWSGVGSEPTPALQGNILLIDDSVTLIMQNGLPVDLKLKGVLSADLSASIKISMWYKTSHSVVNNAVALLVKGSASVETSFINLQGEFSFMGESAIDFITDSDFSDAPFKMCLQMMQPEYLFRNNFLAVEQIPGSKYSVKTTKKRKLLVPAVSFYLHPDNNEQCTFLLGES